MFTHFIFEKKELNNNIGKYECISKIYVVSNNILIKQKNAIKNVMKL
jgi:hypothetical protein